MCVDDIKDKLGARPVPLQIPIGAEAELQGRGRPADDEGAWSGKATTRAPSSTRRRSRPISRTRPPSSARQMIEAAVEMDDDAMAAYLDGKEPDVATLKRLIRKATVTRAFYPDAVRLGLQEQGRAAAARRRRRLSCPRRPIARPSRASTSRPASRPCAGRSTPSRCRCSPSRSWTTRTSARSPSAASIRARVEERHGARQHHARQEGARRPHVPDACRRARGDQGGLRRRHRRAGRPQGHAHRRDAVAIPASRCCSRRWSSPTPSSR